MARRLVTIHVSDSYPEAFLLRSRLEANGINCYIADEYMSTMYGMAGGHFLGGIKLQVSDKDVMLAKTLLNELPAPADDDTGEAGPVLRAVSQAETAAPPAEDKVKIICPSCNSDNCRRENSLGLPEAISVLLQGFPFLRMHYRYRCFDCSNQWED